MKSLLNRITIALVLAGVVGAAAPAMASPASHVKWVKYQAKKYGFSMLVPQGTKFKERQFGPWGELYAKYGVVRLVALAKRNAKATPRQIERTGVKVTGIPARYWKEIGRGKHQGGWIWWRTVTALRHGVRIIADYGAGKKSSYLMILFTTERDYDHYRSNYQTWYGSIQLD